VHPLFIL